MAIDLILFLLSSAAFAASLGFCIGFFQRKKRFEAELKSIGILLEELEKTAPIVLSLDKLTKRIGKENG